MDNKQDRQFYWEVKQFMGNSQNPVSQEKKTSPSLVENIKNVLNKNELYRPTSFNPSINSPNTINNAIGAMEQSKNLGASHSAAHGSNVYGNAFSNTPKNLNEKKDDWNWREHSKEDNIAHGREVKADQDAKNKNFRKETSRRSSPASKPMVYGDADRDSTDSEKRTAYWKERGINSSGLSPEERAKQAEPVPLNPNKKISPTYWVTYGDFETATGEKYDVMNAKHRQLFFDLNSSGESTVAPTAGVGEGPAYDSLAYHTMRRRPANIPPRYIVVDGEKVANPQARYDTVDGTIANTTSQSRGKAQWDADDAAALKRIDAEAAKRDAEIRAEAKRIVDAEQKAATKDARQGYMDQIGDSLNKDDSRTIKEPIRGDGGRNFDVQLRDNNDENMYGSGTDADPIRYSPYVNRSKPGTGISDAQRSVTDSAANTLQNMMRSGSDWMKKQSLNSPGVRYPDIGVNPDVNRGESPIYPEGQVDSTYRQPPGVGVSNIINNLVKSVGDSGKNVAAELQRIMKLNTAQTNPNVIQDKLYGDTSYPVMDTQAKTPPAPHADYVYPNPYNPDIKSNIDADPYNVRDIIDDSESTGGMNEPMDLSNFPDKKATTSKPAGDYVKDIIKPFQDAADQQSTQDKINDILKNLGTSDSKKTSRRSKRKRKDTTRVAMVGEGVDTSTPLTFVEKAKDLAKDAGKAAKEVGSHLAYALPGFHYGSHGIAEPLAKMAGASEEQILPNEIIDTSEKGLVYDWPISTFAGAVTAPYVKELVTGLPRAIGSGVGAGAAIRASAAAASTETMAAMAGLASPVGLAITLGPAAAYGAYKLGEKVIKSYYDVNDKDYDSVQKEQEKYDKDMAKRGAGTNERIVDIGRSETEKQALLAPQDVSDDEINAAIKASRARPSPTK